MDLGLGGKHVLITGGSKGIGMALAHAFAAEGANIVITSRDKALLEKTAGEVARQHNAKVLAFPADLSKGSERERVHAAFPNVDILVNNAGAIPAGGLLNLTMETWIEAWQLKVFGYIHMSQLYYAKMKPRKDGIILNILGMAGRALTPEYICGSTGNAGLIAFTSALGVEAADHGVRVFGINPAATLTDRIMTMSRTRAKNRFGDESRWEETLGSMPFGRIKMPEEVAALSVMLCSKKVEYLAGTVIDMVGGGRYRKA